MRVSELLHAGVEQFLELTPSIKDHIESKSNPHGINKDTVGLGKVSNDLQAKEAEFRAHLEAKTLDHPDKSVTTAKLADGAVSGAKLAPDAVTSDKIAEGAVKSGTIANESISNGHLALSLRNIINGKVEKEEGMGLSKNSFTDEEKSKLAAITVTNGATGIDLASLLSRTEPLKIRKTGQGFETVSSERYFSDAAEMVCFDTFPANGISVVGYRNKSGNFVSAFYKKGKLACKYEGGTGVGHCTLTNNTYIAAEAADGVLTVQKASAMLTNPTFSTWATVPLSVTGEIALRHVFVYYNYDTSEQEMTVIYAPVNYNYLYIDCFTMKTSEVIQKWQIKLNQRSYVSSDTRLLYSSWFKMACMDGSGMLYVAPIYCSTEPYAVLKINRDGEIINRYKKMRTPGAPQYTMRDLVLHEKYLYGFTTMSITRIDTDTGEETNMYKAPNANLWVLRGLMLLPDGHIALYAINTSSGRGHLRLFYTTNEDVLNQEAGFFLDKELADTALICRSANALSPEIEGIYLDEETGELTSKLFQGYDEYTVV